MTDTLGRLQHLHVHGKLMWAELHSCEKEATFEVRFSSPVILPLHAGFEFWDLPGGSTIYQPHLQCCIPPASTARAALPNTASRAKLHAAAAGLRSCAKLAGFKPDSLQ